MRALKFVFCHFKFVSVNTNLIHPCFFSVCCHYFSVFYVSKLLFWGLCFEISVVPLKKKASSLISFQVGIPSKDASSVWSERTSPAHAPRVLKVSHPVPIWQTAVWTWSLLNTRHGCSTSDTWSGFRLKLIRSETKFSLPFLVRFRTSSWENFGCSQRTHFFGCVRESRELVVAQNLARRQKNLYRKDIPTIERDKISDGGVFLQQKHKILVNSLT